MAEYTGSDQLPLIWLDYLSDKFCVDCTSKFATTMADNAVVIQWEQFELAWIGIWKKDNINFSMIFKPVNDARNAYLVEFAREG